MAGYTRQSAASIVALAEISASPLNAEFNQIQAAFHATTGHTHAGTSGDGAKIPLTTSVSGTLPVANGGTGVATFTAGFVYGTGTTALSTRVITGTANEITVTNGSGVSGAPTLSLPTALTFTGKTVTGGTFTGLTSISSATIIATGSLSGNDITAVDTLDVGGAALFESTVDVTGLSTLASVDINAGAIDGTTIGATSASTGVFTTITANTSVLPDINDGAPLGTTLLSWSDLFLASGGVINWDAGDVTITHSANLLTFGGASGGYLFSHSIFPTANDGAGLGAGVNSWSDLFLASGGVINWNNGDVLITHSANAINVNGGNLVMTNDDIVLTDGDVSFSGDTKGVLWPTGISITCTGDGMYFNGASSGYSWAGGQTFYSGTTTIAIYNRTGSAGSIVEYQDDGVNSGEVTVNGATAAYSTVSDETLKDFKELYSAVKAIETIKADPVRTWTWNEKAGRSYGESAIGWGAQSSYAINPDLAVRGDNSWGIDYGKRTPYLWAAVSNILERLEAIEKKLGL